MFVYLKSDGLRGRLLRHLGDNYLATKQQQLLQRLGRLAGHLCTLCLIHAWLLFSRKEKKKHLNHTSDALAFMSITKRKYSLIA